MEPIAPPGWYPSLDGREEQFWDGRSWTGVVRPRMRPQRRSRAFLWFFLAVQALFVAFATLLVAMNGSGDCAGLDQELCDTLNAAATERAVMDLVLVWAAADVILGISYAVYRLAAQPRT